MEQRVTLTDPRKLDYYYEEAIKTLRTNIQFSGRGYQDHNVYKLLPH